MKKLMKTHICLVLFFLGMLTVNAQLIPLKYSVYFHDKEGTPYSISQPEQYLSERAIERRQKYNIAVTEQDFPVNQWYLDSLTAIGVELIRASRWFNCAIIHCVDSSLLHQISNLSFVSNIRLIGYGDPDKKMPNVRKRSRPNTTEKSSRKDKSTGYDYGLSYNQIQMLSGDVMHDMGYRGQDIRIAVMDAGFQRTDELPAFDSLFASNRILGTWDFVNNNEYVYHTSTHGTYVLSLMAANKNGEIVGTAPRASYYLLRTEDTVTEYIVEEYFLICGAEYADSAGADIINISLGYTEYDDISTSHTYNSMNGITCPSSVAVDIAASKGIVVVTSAGNSGGKEWQYIGAPGDAHNIMTVGAVDPFGNYAYFSSTGPTPDGRIKPDVTAQGQDAVVVNMSGGVQTGNGTSFSSPIVAGLMACLLQANPSTTNAQLITAVKESASRSLNPDSLYGWGIPNFSLANMILSGIKPSFHKKNTIINTYPNPFTSELNVQYFSADSQRVSIELRNTAGNTVYRKEHFLRPNGYYIFNLHLPENIAQGVYVLSISDEKQSTSTKIMKQ